MPRPPCSWLSLPILALLTALSTRAQTAVPDANGQLVFKANARTVVLDVVVTARNGKAVQGLHKEDFQIEEDGHPQAITFFDEHTAAQTVEALPDLPPNIFSNIPRVKPTDSVTVLLLDSLNTPLQDQSYVRGQMLKYLKAMEPGTRMAIFALSTRLRFVQGFTTDPAVLAAALRSPKKGSGVQASPLLLSSGENAANQQAAAQLAQSQADHPSAATAGALMALQQFQAEQAAFQTDQRVKITLDALQQLGQYLAGIPGRKNVIWLSGGFPLSVFADLSLNDPFAVQRSNEQEVRKTNAILTASEVALYPVAVEGLATDALYGVDQQMTAVTNAQQAQQQQNKSLQTGSQQRNADHTTMDEIARDTGGVAIYNTNGLNDALARVVDHGSRFYTLAYTPSNSATDGNYRKISVNVHKEGARLAYRRGYYAVDAKAVQAAASGPAADPLHPFMGPGMPASTQIPFIMRILPQPAPSVPHPASPAGDNPKLEGPLTRYAVDFVIAARGLDLNPLPDGIHHGGIETTLVVYDANGIPQNWMVRNLNLDMSDARFKTVQENGVQFRLEIDVPKSGATLRGGVYDQLSHLTGTLEVPLSSIASQQPTQTPSH